jgi:glycosyltransferase involved in cell wall biosynthesis
VASDTAGHREVLEASPEAGRIFSAEDGAALAATLREVLADRAKLEAMKQAARRAAETTFSHERQVDRYVAAAEFALKQSVNTAAE